MKRFKCVLMLLAAALFLTGCKASAMELGDRLAVGLIAVDRARGRYEVSVACLDSRSGGGESSDVGLQYFSASGQTLREAFEQLNADNGNRLFYGHSAGLALSVDSIENALPETVEYFLRDDSTRLSLCVFACGGRAGELIRMKTVDRALSVGAIETIVHNAPSGPYELAPLFKVGAGLFGPSRCASLPLVAARPAEATAAEGEVFELFVASQIGIEQQSGLMYNQDE